jgi:hypothetical protein
MTKAGITAPLGSGSYDYDDLKEATDAVAAGKHGSPQDANQAMEAAVRDTDRSRRHDIDRRDTPGYSWHTRTGPTGRKERILVADGEQEEPSAKKPRKPKDNETSSGDTINEETAGQKPGDKAA